MGIAEHRVTPAWPKTHMKYSRLTKYRLHNQDYDFIPTQPAPSSRMQDSQGGTNDKQETKRSINKMHTDHILNSEILVKKTSRLAGTKNRPSGCVIMS